MQQYSQCPVMLYGIGEGEENNYSGQAPDRDGMNMKAAGNRPAYLAEKQWNNQKRNQYHSNAFKYRVWNGRKVYPPPAYAAAKQCHL